MEIWAEGGLPLKPKGRDSRDSIARQLRMPALRLLVAEDANAVSMTGFGKLGYKKHPEIIYFAKRKRPDV